MMFSFCFVWGGHRAEICTVQAENAASATALALQYWRLRFDVSVEDFPDYLGMRRLKRAEKMPEGQNHRWL